MKDISTTVIKINNAEFYAYHGVKKEEKKLGGKFQVDLELEYDAKEAAIEDSINFAINYEEAIYVVSEVMTNEPFDLIETLAHEILNALFDKFGLIISAKINLRKLNVPMKYLVSNVEVTLSMTRSDIE